MSMTLKADNRSLTNGQKYSYLVYNTPSSVVSINAINVTDNAFVSKAFLLLGSFGSESAEIVQIDTINNTTGEITLISPTKFPHPESTKITVLPYNQIRFWWTPIEVFNTTTPLTLFEDIQASDWFSTYDDNAHPTGFGWFTFYNSETNTYSQESNSLPYAGFGRDTIEDILNDFYSLLNEKELRLVTRRDALSWLNEGFSQVQNRLNLTNREYTTSAPISITTVPGVIEYDLPNDFFQLLSIQAGAPWTQGGASLTYVPLREAFSVDYPRYYIRGKKLGILPSPSQETTYNFMYLKTSPRLESNSDVMDLPNNGQYAAKDYALYRAYQKFSNPQMSSFHKNAFDEGMNNLIISAIDRDANLDQMGIVPEAII